MSTAFVAIAGAALFLTAGYVRPRFRQPPLRRGLAADLLHAFVNGVLLDVPVSFALGGIGTTLEAAVGSNNLRLFSEASLCSQALVFLFAGDFIKWSVHYLQHHVSCLWRLHRLHHATEELDALSAVRTHPVECLVNRLPFLTATVLVLGIDLRIVLAYSALDTLQGLWAHSNTKMRTRWLNYIFATQEFHHWHHATAPEARNRNFGGFLSIWDWILGTAYCPRDRDVEAVGLTGIRSPSRYRDHLTLTFAKRQGR